VKTLATPVSTFVTVTVTPGTSAPEGSVTVPRISPALVLWAKENRLVKTKKLKTSGIANRIFCMHTPPARVAICLVCEGTASNSRPTREETASPGFETTYTRRNPTPWTLLGRTTVMHCTMHEQWLSSN